jgi:hypothetical protein
VGGYKSTRFVYAQYSPTIASFLKKSKKLTYLYQPYFGGDEERPEAQGTTQRFVLGSDVREEDVVVADVGSLHMR